MKPEHQLEDNLTKLLQTRYHGSRALSGFRFQLLYSVLWMLDLLDFDDYVQLVFEGIEDVDLKPFRCGGLYIQVKTSSASQGWSWLAREEILEHFFEVFQRDPHASFRLVTNFPFTGDLTELEARAKQPEQSPTPSLERRLYDLAEKWQIPNNELNRFIKLGFPHFNGQRECLRREVIQTPQD